MDSLSYETMMSAHTNPALPGESLGGLGRTADVQPVYLIPGLVALAIVAYQTYLGVDEDSPNFVIRPLLALVAGGLLSQSIN
jgi:hypothetical protein